MTSPDSHPDSPVAGDSCTITEHRVGDIAVVSVRGTVDMITAGQLDEALASATAGTPQALVVDLSAVDFLASTGIGVLSTARDRLPDGTGFAVVADGPATSRPLDLLGFAALLGMHSTLERAIAAVS